MTRATRLGDLNPFRTRPRVFGPGVGGPRALGRSLVIAVLALTVVSGLRAQSGYDLFQQALAKERAEGKLEDAIALYQRVAKQAGLDRTLAAKALMGMAKCYEKLGNLEARTAYERVLREFGDQIAMAAEARSRLAALSGVSSTSNLVARHLDAYFKNTEEPEISPDGRWIAYTRPRAANGSPRTPLGELDIALAPRVLYLKDLTTGRESILVDDPDKTALVHFNHLRWSPDGRSLAFLFEVMNLRDLNEAASQLRVLSLATRKVTTLFAGAPTEELNGFTWSRDSKRLAFHLVPTHPMPAPPPQDVIYIATIATDAIRTITVQAPSAAGGKTLLDLGGYDDGGRIGWTTNDDLLYWQSLPSVGNDFFLIPATGGTPHRICEGRFVSGGDACAALMPDGRSMVKIKAATSRLVLRDVATGEERPITVGSGEEMLIRASPDGRLVAFKSNSNGKWALYVAPLEKIPVADPLRILNPESEPGSELTRAWWPGGWSSDGRLILKLTYAESNVYRLAFDAHTGRPARPAERLSVDRPWNEEASVGPDGQHIAYWYRGSGQRTGIAIMDIDGSRERSILDHGLKTARGHGHELAWRSASELLFWETVSDTVDTPVLKALNIKTGAVTQGPDIEGTALQYAPATNELFYLFNTKQGSSPADVSLPRLSEVHARSMATNADRTVAAFKDAAAFAVTADGRRIAYTRVRDFGSFKAALADGHQPLPADALLRPFEMRLHTIGEADDKILLQDSAVAFFAPAPVSWSPDGRYLLYERFGDVPYHILDTETLESRPLTSRTTTDVTLQWTSAQWAPDGSLVLTGKGTRSEWLQWSGLTYAAVVRRMSAAAK